MLVEFDLQILLSSIVENIINLIVRVRKPDTRKIVDNYSWEDWIEKLETV